MSHSYEAGFGLVLGRLAVLKVSDLALIYATFDGHLKKNIVVSSLKSCRTWRWLNHKFLHENLNINLKLAKYQSQLCLALQDIPHHATYVWWLWLYKCSFWEKVGQDKLRSWIAESSQNCRAFDSCISAYFSQFYFSP